MCNAFNLWPWEHTVLQGFHFWFLKIVGCICILLPLLKDDWFLKFSCKLCTCRGPIASDHWLFSQLECTTLLIHFVFWVTPSCSQITPFCWTHLYFQMLSVLVSFLFVSPGFYWLATLCSSSTQGSIVFRDQTPEEGQVHQFPQCVVADWGPCS